MVAKIISVSAELGAKRQVFMVSLGGFDTHSGQDTTHPALLTQLAGAIDAFQKAMVELNAAQKVTLFTASDFGRTLTVNGDGTDHGWGGHHFVVGGAVKGKQVVGSYPELTSNGPTDAGNGRLIPTTGGRAVCGDTGHLDGCQRDRHSADPAEYRQLRGARSRLHELTRHDPVGARRYAARSQRHRSRR